MHTTTLHSFQLQRLLSPPGLVKIILPILAVVLFSAYAFYNFSVHHWVFLGLFTVSVLAILSRIGQINETAQDHQTAATDRIYSDGGTSRINEFKSVNTRSVSHDGGSFERSTSDVKSRS